MRLRRVIVIGLDGLEPKIVESMLEQGELPNLSKLRATGGYSRVRTTFPAQTPVAWSTFATGTNPGGHGIFDFIRRDPRTYLPDLALNRYEQKSAFLPPKVVNLRRGTTVWDLLTAAGIPSVVLRCPCTYPPDNVRGRMLSGMGVPDLRGGLGTATFYTSAADLKPRESENVISLRGESAGSIATNIIGPRNPKSGPGPQGDLTAAIRLEIDRPTRQVVVHSEGQPRTLCVQEGHWSDWLKIKFKSGLLQSVSGMLRFYLVRLEPVIELYASPLNFDPVSPMFAISSPWDYATELSRKVGTFYTAGMPEDHTGLSNGRLTEAAYLDQCEEIVREREAMMLYELDRLDQGLFFCLFDTPDRIQHMFWRFREPDHPANAPAENGNAGDGPASPEWAAMSRVIEEHYRRCDEIVGKAMAYADDQTLIVALSDHGFNSFQRGVHLNAWLHENGFLKLNEGLSPGEEAGDLLRNVDWSKTRAYALGLGSIYLNLRGRERDGLVSPEDAGQIKMSIQRGLAGLVDPERGRVAIRSVASREQVYSGEYAEESPDLVVNFSDGYRVSWATALGGVPRGLVEDNVKKWGGDHIIDPALVPGVLFMNRQFDGSDASLVDLAPTILAAFGVPIGPAMEGKSVLA